MDDVTKTLPATTPSSTNTPTVDKGSVVAPSSAAAPSTPTSSAPTDSNALDQILKDLEKQYADEGAAKNPVSSVVTPAVHPVAIPVVAPVVTPVAAPVAAHVSSSIPPAQPSVGTQPPQPAVSVKPVSPMMPPVIPSTSVHPPTSTPAPVMSSGIRAAIGTKAPIIENPAMKPFSASPVAKTQLKKASLLEKIGKAKIVVGAVVLVLTGIGLLSGVLLSQQNTYNLPKASGPCGGNPQDIPYCSSECRMYSCVNYQWTPGEVCSPNPADDHNECRGSSPGGGDTGGTTGGNNKASCGTCGGANQGGCTGENEDCNDGRQCDDASFALCGGGCYPVGWRTCPGQAGCRAPGIACAGSDQCAGVVCASDQHCNGGFCVNNASDTGDRRHPNKFETFMCPQGCGNDGQCTTADVGATSGFGTASTVISPNECGQIDILTWNGTSYEYSQVKQNTCGSAACQHTPPASPVPPPVTPPASPTPPGAPMCIGLSSSISAPQLGQLPVFTCTHVAETTRYEFQWRLGSGAYQSLAPSASGSNVSSPLLVNASGTYTAQCRPCNSTGCASFDTILSVGVGEVCGGIGDLQCAPGLFCYTGPGPVGINQSGICRIYDNGIR